MLAERFLYYPEKLLVGDPSHWGLSFDEVYFPTPDGQRLHGWLIPGGRALTWLWLHGNAGNISHRLDKISLVHHRLGVNVFIFDYRGYGKSTGRPSERGTYHDAAAAYDYLQSHPSIEPGKIVAFGGSLGSAIAIDLAGKRKLMALILESPFTSVPAMAKRAFPQLPLRLVRIKYDSLSKIRHLRVPLLVIHGEADEVVPYPMGQELFAAANEPKRFFAIPGAGHNDTYLVGGEDYFGAIAQFLADLDKGLESLPPPDQGR